MPLALEKTDYVARIVWLGRVPDREAGLPSEACEALELSFDGPEGEAHAGRTRPACGRVDHMHALGTEFANVRQMTILSREELAATAAKMDMEALSPDWVGASIVVEGIPDFTHIPPSSRLLGANGTALVVDMLNHPCTLAGRSVEDFAPGKGPSYKPAAMDKRGVTAWVERPGRLAIGDELTLYIPTQRGWTPTLPGL